MKQPVIVLALLGALGLSTVGYYFSSANAQTANKENKMSDTQNEGQVTHVAAPQKDNTSPRPRVVKTKEEWKKLLPSNVYEVTRRAGTEPPFHNAYWNLHKKGIFVCANCGLELFDSETKFESGTGWPSFYAPIANNRVADHNDTSYGMVRDEVVCARCGAHLGHVFDDGPKPTGLRFCMNSASLLFEEAEK